MINKASVLFNCPSIARILLTWFCLFPVLSVQGQIPVGEWRSHLSYHHIQDVTGNGERIVAAGESGLLIYHEQYNSIEVLDKVTGLSDVPVSVVAFSPAGDLFIGYDNGNLDVWKDGKISNYPGLLQQSLYQEKKIYDITFAGNRSYLACSFGVAVFDTEKNIFLESIRPGAGGENEVYALEEAGGYLYAATQQGLYYAPSDAADLYNPARWQRVVSFPDHTRKVKSLAVLQENLIFAANNAGGSDEVYYLDDPSQSDLLMEAGVRALETGPDHLYVCTGENIRVFNALLTPVQTLEGYIANPSPTSLYASGSEDLWIGDSSGGLVRYHQTMARSILYNGPQTNEAFMLKAFNDRVFGLPGGYDRFLNKEDRKGGLYQFKEEEWSNFSFPAFADFVDFLVHPANDAHHYVASWGDGLLELEGSDLANQYDASNSPLTSVASGQVRVGDLAFDTEENLWMINDGSDYPVKMLDREGNWNVGRYEALRSRRIRGLLVTDQDRVWGYVHNRPLVFVIETRGTPADPSDDEVMVREVLDYNGQSFARRIEALEKDEEGNIWIATDEGIAVDYEPGAFFQREDYRPNRIRLTQDGYTQYVLRDNEVTAVAVDPANRKWFGTRRSGVFVFSPDARRLEAHYTTRESPLVGDTIRSITIDATGEVFISTSRGICSYRSEAARGQNDFSEAYAFPNPVPPEYRGPITITRLVKDVDVKITDVAGNLVYETIAKGGQAIWNGKSLSGRRVQSGVYLIFMTNEDGSQTHVGKLLFIR